ncbi:spore germination protein GerPE [Cohnella laeviribosi]|uniref:spore germination protein GerPE n=1 Tax=Cohnella laeviribosi TaxID=380174 RepID=UPI000372AE3C|nr:spore germination protein GerPE [Cohnella laeviribosi]
MIECRKTVAGTAFINTVSHSGIVQFGDTKDVSSQVNRVIAVQRAVPVFKGDETRFAAYALFYKPLLRPVGKPSASLSSSSDDGTIRIGDVRVIGVTASSILRFGCGGPHTAEARILHIRHFNNRIPLTEASGDRDIR